jgi:hypothetical protein
MRYILFTFTEYYPGGGANDIHAFDDDLQACINEFVRLREDNKYILGHVYNTHDNVIVWHHSSLDVYEE